MLKIRELIADGSLGDIQFIDSVRINLGLVQPDVDVLWDLAPHDLSIIDFILPTGCVPWACQRHGADPLGAGQACVGHLTFALANGAMAHVHVNWLSPTKIRQPMVGGSQRTLVWDDLNPQQRISVYDQGIEPRPAVVRGGPESLRHLLPGGRHVVAGAARTRGARPDGGRVRRQHPQQRPARTSGVAGLRVLSVLEAVSDSLSAAGNPASSSETNRNWRQADEYPARGQILVTGGAGTIGSTIVDQLLDAGAGRVDVLDNLVRGRRANLDRRWRAGGSS